MREKFDLRKTIIRATLVCAAILWKNSAAWAIDGPHIAIMGALPPLTEATDAENAAATLKRDGFAPDIVTPEQIADAKFFTPARFAALIAPHSRLFPAVAQANLLAYLRGQGKLICIGGPAFERYVYRENGVWKLRESLHSPLPAELAAVKSPDLPTVSPPDQVFHVGSEIAGAWLPIARDRGIGLAGTRTGRLLPADGRGSETEYSPEVRKRHWGYLSLAGPMRGAIWALNPKANAPNDPTFTPLTALLKRILQGVYLIKTGAEIPAYSVGQPVVMGAEFVNFSAARKIAMEIEIRELGEQPYQKFIIRPSETLASGGISGYNETLRDLLPGQYLVRATLFEENGAAEDDRPVLDRLTAPFRVLPAPNPAAKSPVAIAPNRMGLLRGGRPFIPEARDFSPAWTVGEIGATQKQNWLTPERYDPELISGDLTAAQKRGDNVLRIVYRNLREAPALRDLLAQCQHLNLLVDIVLLEADVKRAAALLDAAQISGDTAVFGIEILDGLKTGRAQFLKSRRQEGLPVGSGLTAVSPTQRSGIKILPGTNGLDFLVRVARPVPRTSGK